MARPSAAPAAQPPTLRGLKPKAVATERKQKSLGRLAERCGARAARAGRPQSAPVSRQSDHPRAAAAPCPLPQILARLLHGDVHVYPHRRGGDRAGCARARGKGPRCCDTLRRRCAPHAPRPPGAERRRIYDLFNICEAVGLMFRRCMNEYAWAGTAAVAPSLARLQVRTPPPPRVSRPPTSLFTARAAPRCRVRQASQRAAARGGDGRSAARRARHATSPPDPPLSHATKASSAHSTPASGCHARKAALGTRRNNATPLSAHRVLGVSPLYITVGDGATALRVEFGVRSSPKRRPNSLCALTQRFVAFFLDHVRGSRGERAGDKCWTQTPPGIPPLRLTTLAQHPYQTMERIGECIVAECQQQGLNAKSALQDCRPSTASRTLWCTARGATGPDARHAAD